jgi:SAM-dependent methyltransferase
MQRDLQAENKVRNFYDGQGWSKTDEGVSVDAALWEDLRPAAEFYVTACRRKLLARIPASGKRILDAASGPIQYPEYLEYSKGYEKRYCVDISESALKQAQEKLGDRGEYFRSSILELPFEDSFFDATISLHTIYHIDRDQQAAAVRQLIRVTREDSPVIIIYANPDRLFAMLKRWIKGAGPAASSDKDHLYYFAHPLSWWKQFKNECEVTILPWRSLTAKDSHRLVPNNIFGRILFRSILAIENWLPKLAARWGAYPLIVLTKKTK